MSSQTSFATSGTPGTGPRRRRPTTLALHIPRQVGMSDCPGQLQIPGTGGAAVVISGQGNCRQDSDKLDVPSIEATAAIPLSSSAPPTGHSMAKSALAAAAAIGVGATAATVATTSQCIGTPLPATCSQHLIVNFEVSLLWLSRLLHLLTLRTYVIRPDNGRSHVKFPAFSSCQNRDSCQFIVD
ncbi:unnamed protein product [Protopolystoma xenopodis]|uniref:Uncharacterized protein n=1 Tax=Protopolystoma xenopodis TaxID=117903 RepID=A0A3S5CLB7_9PLAT|nr:unnamed protein product [Protopolystoma xenopodis]